MASSWFTDDKIRWWKVDQSDREAQQWRDLLDGGDAWWWMKTRWGELGRTSALGVRLSVSDHVMRCWLWVNQWWRSHRRHHGWDWCGRRPTWFVDASTCCEPWRCGSPGVTCWRFRISRLTCSSLLIATCSSSLIATSVFRYGVEDVEPIVKCYIRVLIGQPIHRKNYVWFDPVGASK